ncbi:MAG: LysR family transcriptional regulator [Pseudomonadota bacterium]
MFDWEDMRAFAALARSGSLAAAARALKVNHATIGRRVAALEAALGVPLVERLGRGIALTAQGIAIAELAEQMESGAGAILARTGAPQGLAGTLTLGAPPVLAGTFVIPKLAPFRDANPDLRITVSAIPAIAALDRGGLDLAIRLTRPEQPAHLLRRLGSIAFALYAIDQIAMQPQEDWTFIGYDGELDHLTQQRWLADYAGYRPTLFRTTDMIGQLAAVRAGMGVALIPRFLAARAPELVAVDPGAAPPRRTIWLTTYAAVQKFPAVRAIADHLVEVFEQSPDFSPNIAD